MQTGFKGAEHDLWAVRELTSIIVGKQQSSKFTSPVTTAMDLYACTCTGHSMDVNKYMILGPNDFQLSRLFYWRILISFLISIFRTTTFSYWPAFGYRNRQAETRYKLFTILKAVPQFCFSSKAFSARMTPWPVYVYILLYLGGLIFICLEILGTLKALSIQKVKWQP